ncbi:MAG: hypothetical protein U1A78_28965 [Polyangia bacterium]
MLGQGDPVSGLPNRNGPPDLDTLRSPVSVSSDGTRLAVCDNGNSRVLIWLSLPTRIGQPADVVLGQPNASSATPNKPPTRGALNLASEIESRILYFAQVPKQNGQPADRVLGQPDFVSTLPNNPDVPVEERMIGPVALAAVGNRLLIADYNYSRVLVRGLAE